MGSKPLKPKKKQGKKETSPLRALGSHPFSPSTPFGCQLRPQCPACNTRRIHSRTSSPPAPWRRSTELIRASMKSSCRTVVDSPRRDVPKVLRSQHFVPCGPFSRPWWTGPIFQKVRPNAVDAWFENNSTSPAKKNQAILKLPETYSKWAQPFFRNCATPNPPKNRTWRSQQTS